MCGFSKKMMLERVLENWFTHVECSDPAIYWGQNPILNRAIPKRGC